ncbi:MAG: hypothetical protein H7Y11_14950, partial [Armatimonadetes bacterium]|nr:hypothetical protein [Anaerolineae bacterium]
MSSQAHDYFQTLLVTVLGQAFAAAGYHLVDNPMQQAGGFFKFESERGTALEFQHLAYQDTEWSSGQASRFRVMLLAHDGRRRDLSALVVDDFAVAILPSARHWWQYQDTHTLGQALLEAGKLTIGY